MPRTRYAQVGVGGRSWLCTESVVGKYAEGCELVALCDNNAGRLAERAAWLQARGLRVPTYDAAEFDRLVSECRPDCVVVTTKDCYHDVYICRAMELGCDVITEKPMTIDAARCQRIIDTQRRTGKKCTVTFNYRYAPAKTHVKELLMSGVIGDILSVDFHWVLDTVHGADYFRRWHRNKQNSGGLMVHKATHHFDLVNWWLSSVPVSVFAMGHRHFYTPQQALRYGLRQRGERCLDCRERERCPFVLKSVENTYRLNEEYDGYIRDRCVFSDQIDIEDSMNLVVAYASGAKMSYSLNAFLPWEGYIVSYNGSRGRLEFKCEEQVWLSEGEAAPEAVAPVGTSIQIFPHFQAGYSVEPWTGSGGHSGGDERMAEDLFSPCPPYDKYMRAADQRAGAYSILTGIAANLSMSTGQLVYIDDLVHGIGLPDFPPMPGPLDPLEIGAPRALRTDGEKATEVFARSRPH